MWNAPDVSCVIDTKNNKQKENETLIKLLILLFGLMLAGCAGNLNIDGRHYRVSSCDMNDKGEVSYVVRGVHKLETPKFAHYETTFFSYWGADTCGEWGLFCKLCNSK